MKSLALPGRDWALVVAGALLLTLAYPPFHLLVPSFVCLVPAVLLMARAEGDPRPNRRLLAQGFWFGTVSNGLVLYWLIVALWRFTKLSALAYLVTIVIMGLFTAVLFALVAWLGRKGVTVLVAFPALWTALEWLIGHLPDVGFPWLGLGSSLTGFPTLVQIADVAGARGITLLLVLANTALAVAWFHRRTPRRAALFVGGVVIGALLVTGYGVIRERQIPLREVGEVALIQPNVGYDEKRRSAPYLDSLVRALVVQSVVVVDEGDPDLVIWPEVAVPYYFDSFPSWEIAIQEHAARAGTPIVVGGLDAASDEYFNSAFLFDSTGRHDTQPVYHKRELVPIVERVPFIDPRWIDLDWFGGFGVGGPGPVYEVGIGRFGVLICYESIFEYLSRDYRRRGADFLVNITNDAWYGLTSAPYQHAAHLVMRAIENRVGIARGANSGISQFVDPLGRTHQSTRLEVKTAVTGVLMTSDVVPPYTRWGDWVGVWVVVLSLGLCAWAWSRKR